MNSWRTLALLAFVATFSGFSSAAYAVEEITVVIKDHKFEPATVEVAPGAKVKLIIDNQDPTPEEFESHELNREKVIQGNSKGVVMIGPLEEGTYPFFGEFNQASAQGQIIVKAPGSTAAADGQEPSKVEASSGEAPVEAAAENAPAAENSTNE